MTKETIVAADMNAALREVKERFGSEAYILESRTLRERIPGSMDTRHQVELTVSLQAPAGGERQELPPLQLDGEGRFVSGAPGLEAEIRRMERLVAEIEEQEARLAGLDEPYPLLEALRGRGLREDCVQSLVREFEEEVPRVDRRSTAAALERIRGRLRCVGRMKIRDLRGVHAFMGPAGSGKTSLALKLAARIAGGRRRVVLLAYSPRHGGEVLRLEEASRSHGFEVALADELPGLLGALRHLRSRDLLLLDLPPLEEGQAELLSRVERELRREPIYRHLVLGADARSDGLAARLEGVDFLALTRADRADPLPPALESLEQGDLSLGFLSSGPGPDSPLELARPDALMARLEAELSAGRAAGAGGGA